MKRFAALMLVLGLAMFTIGCAEGKKPAEKPAEGGAAAAPADDAAAAPAAADAAKPAEEKK